MGLCKTLYLLRATKYVSAPFPHMYSWHRPILALMNNLPSEGCTNIVTTYFPPNTKGKSYLYDTAMPPLTLVPRGRLWAFLSHPRHNNLECLYRSST